MGTKPILEILLEIRKELEKRNENGLQHYCGYALCNISREVLDTDYHYKFKDYLKKSHNNKKWFFDCDGCKTQEKGHFYWKVGDYNSRLEWLNKRIKLEQAI